MQMRPAIQLQALMKSMKDTVLPAIDPTNRLALEQANLILGMMNIMAQRIDLEYRYDRDELERILGLAAIVKQQAQGGPDTLAALRELDPLVTQALDVHDRARAEPSELLQTVRSLRDKLGEVIRAIFAEGDPATKEAIGKAVLAKAKEQLLRERSWLIMMGYEADPSKIPPIETLISPVR
ncbi:MAG: hypothetical protein AB2L11_09995 [Syntrophobacteraceae bacterium]